MPEFPGGDGVTVVALPVVFDLDFLPYFPAHATFMEHQGKCEQCHMGAFHREELPEGFDLYCEEGEKIVEEVGDAVQRQHEASMRN